MEAIIFIGLQASGKSSFYREKFSDTHMRINLDMLKTRHREKILFNACLEAKQPLVIDNTNPTIEDRKRYISIAKEKQFQIIGYYFKADLEKCKLRNNQRDRSIPLIALLATYQKLQIPTYQEGFDRLYYVSIDKNNSFVVEEWNAV
jgi:predicted kinase